MRMKIGETGVGVLVMVVCKFVDGMRAIDARCRVCRCVQEVAGVAGVSPGAGQAMRGWRQRCPSWTGRRQAPRLGLGRVVDSTPLQSVVVSGPVSDPPHAPIPRWWGKRVSSCLLLFLEKSSVAQAVSITDCRGHCYSSKCQVWVQTIVGTMPSIPVPTFSLLVKVCRTTTGVTYPGMRSKGPQFWPGEKQSKNNHSWTVRGE